MTDHRLTTPSGGVDTKAIQDAIDSANAQGGGRVVLSAGSKWRSGTIVLKSYVELH